MPKGQIPLVDIAPGMLTSYLPRGRGTRLANGRIPTDTQVMSVRQAKGGGWQLAPNAAEMLQLLDNDVQGVGGARVRLTDAWRDPRVQARARSKYAAWVAAGRPDPSSSAFIKTRMKAAYVAKPGESMHGCGCAIDIDVAALNFPGTEQGSDEALAVFWELAAARGWTPVIREPHAGQSEAWHFDHLGGLRGVYELFRERSAELPRYARAYSLTATVGSLLANTMPRSEARLNERYIQARLLIGGFWCGLPDGIIGPMTVRALQEATEQAGISRRTPVGQILGLLNASDVGIAEIERC